MSLISFAESHCTSTWQGEDKRKRRWQEGWEWGDYSREAIIKSIPIRGGWLFKGGRLIEGRLLFEEVRYFEIWDELSVHDGVIFKGQWWIILQTLRQRSSRSYTTWVARLFMQSTGDSILARHECRNHWLHPEMQRLYVTSE